METIGFTDFLLAITMGNCYTRRVFYQMGEYSRLNRR